MNKISLSSLTTRQKQLLVFLAIGVGVLGISVGGVWLTNNSRPKVENQADKPVTTKIATPGVQPGMKEVWISKSEGQLKDLEQQLKILKEDVRTGKTERVNVEKESKRAEEAMKAAKSEQGRTVPSVSPPAYRGTDVRGPQSLGNVPGAQRNNGGGPPAFVNIGENRPAGIFTVSLGGEPRADSALATLPKAEPKSRTIDNYIFSGAITQAILLSGIDAPTGGQAQGNPHPVLLKLTNLSILPSRLRHDMRECFVLAGGYGDISSERAYLRTEKISCSTKDGRVIDHELKGFIAGPDGKAGIRGRLVTKQGQILMNALLAGIGSGIGSAFKQSNTTTSISPLGATQTVDSQKVVDAGLGEGIHSAMDRLAKYYIDLANKLFPVVEIDAGWNVDMIVTEGFYFGEDQPASPRTANTGNNNQMAATPFKMTTGAAK